MKILHVIRSLDPSLGGVVECVRLFSHSDLRSGNQVGIATLDPPDSPWFANYRATIHPLGPAYGTYGYSYSALRRLKEVSTGYDILVAEGIWQYSSLLVRKACGINKPYVVYTHGMLDPWFRVKYPMKHIKKSIYWHLFEKKVLENAKAVIFTAEDEKNLSSDSFGEYKCSPEILPLGIVSPPSSADDIGEQILAWKNHQKSASQRPFALFLGRIHPKKGLDILLRAMAQCSSKNWDLVVAGPDPDLLIPELRILATKLGISDRIHWVGMLSGNTKWGALRSADIFCLPSHQENFGIAVVESLAAGTPVLISRRVNIWKEIIADEGGNAADNNPASFSTALNEWFESDAACREQKRLLAKQCFSKNFELDQASSARREFLSHLLKTINEE